ncbi:hypothetical protein ALC56_05605, partial [Trachymyrmex septentrionalis]
IENHERVERELMEQCGQVATLVECFAWLQRCDESIERFKKLCRAKHPRLAVGHRQSMDGKDCNVDYIEPRRFLEDAREIVLERVRDAVERHGNVKVNTAFNGEFTTNNKRDIKSINTKNIEIYGYIDLREWYEQHIIEPTLTSLEEFQKCDSRSMHTTSKMHRVNSNGRLPIIKEKYLESFYSSLTGDTVSKSNYAHAANIWQRFSIRTLGEYNDLYLKIDVLLLADIFENFRENCVASYGLDPAHYYILPGFTWDAMLKHTRVKFELFTDIDMIMFIERGTRGGQYSQCSGRYAQTNNKYMHLSNPSELRITKIHRVLQFAQSPWLRDYIKLNTNFRRAMIAKPNFHSRSVFVENLIAVELCKLEVKFNKPIYLGMRILCIRGWSQKYPTQQRKHKKFGKKYLYFST